MVELHKKTHNTIAHGFRFNIYTYNQQFLMNFQTIVDQTNLIYL